MRKSTETAKTTPMILSFQKRLRHGKRLSRLSTLGGQDHIARPHIGRHRNVVGQHLRVKGYFVSTVGRYESVIRMFKRNHKKKD